MYLLRLGAMVVPLAAYFLYLGAMNGRRHPTASLGTRDGTWLTLGLVWLVLAGPLGPVLAFTGRWVDNAVMVALVACLLGLTVWGPSRIIVYNVDGNSLLEALTRALDRLQWDYQRHHDWIFLPGHGASLEVRYFAAMRNATLCVRRARRTRRTRRLARRLVGALRVELARQRSPGRSAGWCFLGVSVALFACPVVAWLSESLPLNTVWPSFLGG